MLPELGRSCKDHDHTFIRTSLECQAAVHQLKRQNPIMEYAGEEYDPHWPKGCYHIPTDNLVFLNTFPFGHTHEGAQQICVESKMFFCIKYESYLKHKSEFLNGLL